MVDGSTLQVNDQVLVHPGDDIPIDGTVIAGHSEIDMAVMTGEALPV